MKKGGGYQQAGKANLSSGGSASTTAGSVPVQLGVYVRRIQPSGSRLSALQYEKANLWVYQAKLWTAQDRDKDRQRHFQATFAQQEKADKDSGMLLPSEDQLSWTLIQQVAYKLIFAPGL